MSDEKIAPVADATQESTAAAGPLTDEQKNPTGYAELKELPAPTVGRVVYFRDETGKDRAAHITDVHPEAEGVDVVDLFVIFPHNFVFMHGIERRADTSGFWDWMPFQKGVKR